MTAMETIWVLFHIVFIVTMVMDLFIGMKSPWKPWIPKHRRSINDALHEKQSTFRYASITEAIHSQLATDSDMPMAAYIIPEQDDRAVSKFHTDWTPYACSLTDNNSYVGYLLLDSIEKTNMSLISSLEYPRGSS